MNKNVPIFGNTKGTKSFLRFKEITGNKGWDIVIFVTIFGVVVLVFFYVVLKINATISSIRYSPNDVVYGDKIHAVHSMDPSANSQYSNFSQAGQTGLPKFQISESFYDFGEVNAGQVLTRTFIIANKGDSPLEILRAFTTCGCTTAELTASVIPPGKVILMTLRFDTGFHNMSGSTVRRGVMIETNDPNYQIQEIWIQATVR